ncbi:RagB/SusD family nutrient uptake outer membrane protein [Bacteroides sp. UBA939]|uniref:RagB/SusD family nutrient uptake outer membrane protein n=1 Tax=Bacteroides sp. UBA939 TaxID=1946092 RepID=UPI0025BC930B|nr:RagB/SusD family nutrient uptake outer membrane protein [Bacteroides sp. UBA939]
MKKYSLYTLFIIGVLLTGCEPFDKFLDTSPDNRTDIDTEEKVSMLLVNAYPMPPIIMAELSSDNGDKRHATSATSSAYESLYAEVALWLDQVQDCTDSADDFWQEAYYAIAHANAALQAIEDLGSPTSLNAQKGEALMCRAWSHFLLVNIFGLHYNAETSASDLGVYYMKGIENTVNPKYERESVLSNYQNIEEDILAGLPLVDNDSYSQPKWHFNKKAAYAFATRFYLYKGDYQKVIEYATLTLTKNPASLLPSRSFWPNYGSGNSTNFAELSKKYTSSEEPANLMIANIRSRCGNVYANYGDGKLWSVSPYLADTELMKSPGIWGSGGSTATFYPYVWTASSSSVPVYVIIPKTYYTFQTTDVVNNTGYRTATKVIFSALETLLCRAEAYIMTEQYDLALADMNMWLESWCVNIVNLTDAGVHEIYGKDVEEWTPESPTLRRRFGIQLASDKQDAYLNCVTHFRRIETVFDGLRWFDLKRLKMDVVRREISSTNDVSVLEKLQVGDKRFAIQLPKKVIASGLAPNPR